MEQLKKLFDDHVGELRTYAWYKTGDEETANDLVQEAFVKLWTKRREVKWDQAKGLLYTMISSMAIDLARKAQVKARYENELVVTYHKETPEYELEHRQFKAILEQCISQLPEGAKDAFLLNRLESLSYKDIATQLQISVKAIEKRISTALRLLRSCTGQKIN